MAGSCAASLATFCPAVLLGESLGKEIVELGARQHLFRDDGHASTRPVSTEEVRDLLGKSSASPLNPYAPAGDSATTLNRKLA